MKKNTRISKKWICPLLILFVIINLFGQKKIETKGQVSLFGSYAPTNDLDVFLGTRYIPEFSYQYGLDSNYEKSIDFEASINIYGNTLLHPFDTARWDGNIQPYRLWGRYKGKQFELRVGLQKIDFGAAILLRPIQWFNQIDPRDPLSLTNGVYGVLGRYYFLNNANIWLWSLYGNEKTRGFDALETNKKIPEFGGRIQFPTSKGEIAFSYHYRTASSTNIAFLPKFEKIPEHRIGLDGKWDLKIGLWAEAVFTHKTKNLGILTNQALFNIGTDYTFGIGNGLNVILENLTITSDEQFFNFKNFNNFTASTVGYPLGFFDSISAVLLYNWTAENVNFSLNYQHQFERVTSYVIAFYNPSTASGFQQNELVNQFSGGGIRLMLVYNY